MGANTQSILKARRVRTARAGHCSIDLDRFFAIQTDRIHRAAERAVQRVRAARRRAHAEGEDLHVETRGAVGSDAHPTVDPVAAAVL